MSWLKVTLIDVGWGDSILLESQGQHGDSHYALIDSNDTSSLRSAYIFLRRHFEKAGIDIPTNNNLFDWVILSHIHSDHGTGLKAIMKDFGTGLFLYPKSERSPLFFSQLLTYANRSDRIERHQALDNTKSFPNFGDATIKVLWPKADTFDPNENNNSIVLLLTLGEVSAVLSGDAEIEVWEEIADQIPGDTRFFKVPHHGSSNGMFDADGDTPWLNRLPYDALIAISSHIKPFSHPSRDVVERLGTLDDAEHRVFRTDEQYHLTFWTDGHETRIKYSHEE